MIAKYLLLFIIASAKTSYVKHKEDPLIVHLPNGKIRGHELKSENNNVYYAYQEIPFAAPPVDELRFKEPRPAQNWDGILETTKNTKICYQVEEPVTPGVNQTEDCLYLNVYTPKKSRNNSCELLPVLFWVYGGSFTWGDGTFQLYGPKYFMDYDIVLVTINYRLGPLGFLTTGDGVIPGNLGLKDQNFALKWTKENIKLFGGDPTKITIAGESAGAASVGHLLMSKQSSGLFRGVILQSGTSICFWAQQSFSRYYAYQMGSTLSNSFGAQNSSKELLQLLQTASASDIMKANIASLDGRLIWVPIIEDETLRNALVVGPMEDNLEKGKINRVPIMIGFNSEEELLFLEDYPDVLAYLKQQGANYDVDLSLLINTKFNMTTENKKKAGEQVREIYTKGRFQDDPAAVVKYLSDESFNTPAIRHAAVQSSYTDVYLYEFSYKGDLGFFNVTVEGTDNVAHSEELFYMWDLTNLVNASIDWSALPPKNLLTRQRVMLLWTNFVKYLNPTPKKDHLLENVIWPKVSPNNITYLNINATLEVGRDPKKYKEWKSIIDMYAIPPLVNY